MKRITKRSSIIAVTAAATLVVGGGVAFAYWTSSGSGTAEAAVANSTGNLTVAQDGTISGLYPGGDPVDVNVIVSNPTNAAIGFSDVTITVTGTEKPAGTPNPGCTPADFKITDTPYAGEVVAAGGATAVIAPKQIQMLETGANQDPCKGAVVKLSLSAS